MTTTNTAEIRETSRRVSAADYAGTIRSFYPFWDTLYRPYLLLALDALPRERFDFKPRPDMLTARQIVVHIAENARRGRSCGASEPTRGDAPAHSALVRAAGGRAGARVRMSRRGRWSGAQGYPALDPRRPAGARAPSPRPTQPVLAAHGDHATVDVTESHSIEL